MRAAAFAAFGGPDVIEVMDLPTPPLAAGEVLVKVAATTINPTDILMREGKQVALMSGLEPPYVAGMEFAGHVDHVQPNGRFQLGDAVMGVVNPRRPARGAHAELVAVAEHSLIAVPPGMDLANAATLPMNGLTAIMALDLLELSAGSRLLVTGAAGVVGGYVVQIAVRAGIVVVADALEADRDHLRGLGVRHVVQRGPAMADQVRALFPDGVDGLVDAALLGDAAAALVRDGGAAAALRSSNPISAGRIRAEFVSVAKGMNDASKLARLSLLVRDGVLTPRIAARFPIAGAADAYRFAEKSGLRGRVVMTM